MTNRTHPAVPAVEVVEELVTAAVAIAKTSSNPLKPVMEMSPMPTGPSDMPVPIETDEEVYALHMAGHTPTQIAHHFTKLTGVRWTGQDVDRAIRVVASANVSRTQDQLVYAAQLELDRIEATLRAIWPSVLDGNLQAIDRATRLSTEKRKMLGLDAPDVQVQLRLGSSEGMDYSTLTTEELKTLQTLQRKAASSAKQKVVSGRHSS